MNQPNQRALKQQADQLYEQYAKPLIEKHRGEYIAVSASGQTVIAHSLDEVMNQSLKALGRGAFIFQLGKKAIYQWQ